MAKSKVKNLNQEAYNILRHKWGSMITRCTNPNAKNYANYGGRGITVCDEWRTFSNFFIWSINNGFKPGLSIDRIDVNKGYSPDNCRFITMEQQQQNRRNNRYFIDPFDGEQLCLTSISKKYGISEETLRKRIDKYHMSLEKALTKSDKETARWHILIDPIDGERLCLTEIARKYNMYPITLETRIRNGWDLETALLKPVKKKVRVTK